LATRPEITCTQSGDSNGIPEKYSLFTPWLPAFVSAKEGDNQSLWAMGFINHLTTTTKKIYVVENTSAPEKPRKVFVLKSPHS